MRRYSGASSRYRPDALPALNAGGPGSRGQGRPPILYTVHLADMPLGGIWRWLSDFGDRTHAPSVGVQRWLLDQAHVPAERISVIPHRIDIARYPRRNAATKLAARNAMGLPPEAIVAAFVGRLDDPKNPQWVLRIADMPGVRFVFAGDGPHMADMRRIIAQRNIGDRVLMLGDCDALPVYQAADALLLPSLREGFGLARRGDVRRRSRSANAHGRKPRS